MLEGAGNEAKEEVKEEIVVFPEYSLKYRILPRTNSLIESIPDLELKLKKSQVLVKSTLKAASQQRLVKDHKVPSSDPIQKRNLGLKESHARSYDSRSRSFARLLRLHG